MVFYYYGNGFLLIWKRAVTMDSVLFPNEIELFVEAMQPQVMKKLGSEQWLDWHNKLQKLNQEAILEAAYLKEEHVKEALVSLGKVKVLVHEAILINIWKYKVLPKLLELDPNPEGTFIAYSVLYHEGVCISLLELVMYHASCCEALEDSSVDLLDYICGVISQLLNVQEEQSTTFKESAEQELLRQRAQLSFEIGIRALTILRYLAENMESLPISICTRIYATHDVPILLTEIMLLHPWIKNGKQFIKGKWKDWDRELLGQAEAQVWLTLRHILLDPECLKYYPITESRRNQLTKLLPLMKPSLLDQCSPLMELKHWLCKVSCLQEYAAPPKPLVLEVILEIKQGILRQCEGKWKKIAAKQLEIIFGRNSDSLREAAQKLTDAYNTDLLEQFDVNESQICARCGNSALQRCSKCKKSWYCSRTCQVSHWPQHKECCQN